MRRRLAMPLVAALLPSLAGAQGQVVTGADAGGGPHVKRFDALTAASTASFFAYPSAFLGGVRVAAGDVNGDGVPDVVTGTGPGAAGGHVKVFDGVTNAEIRSFLAYPGFTGGVYVAAGDVTGDGRADLITGADAGGGPHVKVFDGATNAEIRSFFAYGGAFTGGVRVAAGDVNGDGRADIITGAGSGSSGHVKVFDGATGAEIRSFLAYPGFAGGVFVAAGDVTGDGLADLITGAGAAPAGAPHVKVFDGATNALVRSFLAYGAGFTGGVRVGATYANRDPFADIVTGPGAGMEPLVKIFDGQATAPSTIQTFDAYDARFLGGVFVGGDAAIVRAVPEPGTAALLLLGGVGLAAARARRRLA